ncbi:MAG: BMP family ABC transporter substrate-binding protein [Treponema sp.]|nr:BMP family ABC transporter substrate-binding protein [Treponema sp.]
MKKNSAVPAVFCVMTALLAGSCGARKTDPAVEAVTVRLLTDATGIDDKSFNAAAWRGILEFYGDTWDNAARRGKNYDVIAIPSEDMYTSIIRQVTEEGCGLIVATGFTFTGPLETVAAENPDQHYMIIDVDTIGLPNVLQAVYAEHEGSYLVGAAAALKAKADGIPNPGFGFIGAVPGAVITKFEVGYVQGILSVIPGARIVDTYFDNWGAPALAKSQAKDWFDDGIYAVYSASGENGLGTIAQAKEYRSEGKNVWAVGSDLDQYEEGLYGEKDSAVLTSMLKRIETSLVYALNAEKNGTFKGEVITFDVEADGVGYSASNPALTADIKNSLETMRKQIISGEIKIASTYAEAKRIYGFPPYLKALDN